MPHIILATLNAKYIHAAFGLRYLLANLGSLRPKASMIEFDINQRPLDIAEALLAKEPKIIGLGVYIWNVTEMTELVATLKQVRPSLTIVLGGPEVSYETECQSVVQLADYVITGEADLKFAELCAQLLAGQRPEGKVIPAQLPELSHLVLPYDLYDDADISHRVIYVEASRGCPFSCEFCLSSLDIPVRQIPLDKLLSHLERLLQRGVKQFKFVDRTFNLNLNTSRTLLQFFLDRYQPGLFFHFEMVPDRLPEALREIIARFPPGALQFEVGIQSFNDEVCQRISRRQDVRKLEDNLHFLRCQTGVHLHTDLIFGLPGESLESFAAGFDRLIGLNPQEIQVGILKRLRGTPIVRHDAEWRMVYNPHPPYEILENKLLEFGTVQRMRRFARYWDLVGNSGNFKETTPLIWTAKEDPSPTAGTASNMTCVDSPFAEFMKWSQWLHSQIGRTDGIALARLTELLFTYLTQQRGHPVPTTAETIWRDYQRAGRRDKPEFLRAFASDRDVSQPNPGRSKLPKRQSRHLAAKSG